MDIFWNNAFGARQFTVIEPFSVRKYIKNGGGGGGL